MAEQIVGAEALHEQKAALKRKFNDSDERIVWPPVVIIENTITHFDEQENSWKGLGNEELRSFLKGFRGVEFGKVAAVYGPYGNRGKSLVMFPATASGYFDAQTLCEWLERDQRGRHHWLQVSHIKDPHAPGKVTSDGKKILYGYLASEWDMHEVDSARKTVKRWSMESYTQKVLQPLHQCDKVKEEARKRRADLIEAADQKLRAVEQNKEEVDKAAEQFRKINKEIEALKKQGEEQEARHRRSFEERKIEYGEEKLQKLESIKQRERNIREHLEQNNIAKKNAVIQFEELAQRLKDGISLEKRNHELRSTMQQQLEMINRIKLDSLLEAEMEEKLVSLKEKFQHRQHKLQRRHNEQIMKCQEKLFAEKELFLEEKLRELKNIEIEGQEAKKVTIATQEEIKRECIICFVDIVAEKLERALFESCGHANICSKCARRYWKKALKQNDKKPSCPTCKTVQQEKFSLLPGGIYR